MKKEDDDIKSLRFFGLTIVQLMTILALLGLILTWLVPYIFGN